MDKNPQESGSCIMVDYQVSNSQLYFTGEAIATNCFLGAGTLDLIPYDIYPLEATQKKLWRTVYIIAEGDFIQIRIYYSDEQLMNTSIAWSTFVLHSMLLYAKPTGGF